MVAEQRVGGGLSTRRACSKCRGHAANLCGLSTYEVPTKLFIEEKVQDPYIFFVHVNSWLHDGAESSYEDSVMDSTTMKGCHPPTTVHRHNC